MSKENTNDSKPTMEPPEERYLKIFRKAYPQEVLGQLTEILTEKGFMWWDIVGAFQEPLRKRGVKICEIDPADVDDPNASDDWGYLCFVDEKIGPEASAGKQP